MLDALYLAGAFGELPDNGIGVFERGAVWQLGGDDRVSLILCGNEAPWHD